MRSLCRALLRAPLAFVVAACASDPVAVPTVAANLDVTSSDDVSATALAQFEITVLPLLPGGTWSEATAINDGGSIVGYGNVTGGAVHAFVYRNGAIQDLGNVKGYLNSRAYGINVNGQVVGAATTTTRPRATTAVIWSPSGQISPLPGTDTVRASTARAINRSGMVVGSFRNANGDMHPARWTGGALEDYLPLMKPGLSGEARAVNDAGVAVGFGDFYSPFSLYQGARWDAQKTATFFPPLNNGTIYADSSELYDINNAGNWVGWSDYPIAGVPEGVHFTWLDGELYPPQGVVGAHEVALSDRKRLVGTLRLSTSRMRAYTNTTYMFPNGLGEMLPIFPYAESKAADVNACGRVVGWVVSRGATTRRAVLWTRWARGTQGRVYPCD